MEGAAGSERVVKRVCPFCEGMCGIAVTVVDDTVVNIRPDTENAWSQGHVCPKGIMLGEVHHDPDRLLSPMIRTGDHWASVTWDEAFAHAERLVARVLPKHGHGAIAGYIGNMSAKGFGSARYAGRFFALGKIPNIYSSSLTDQHPKNVVCHLMYGAMWRIPIPDLDRTDLFVVMGANPAASKGSIFSHRDVLGAMRDLRARGGRVVVVDPVQTATAQKADQWIAIRPGTDAAFLLAVANVLFAENLVAPAHLTPILNGLEEVRELAGRFPPEKVEAFCGVSAGEIRGLALEIGRAKRAAVYGRIGLCTQSFGTLSSWLIEVIAILTGNLDRIGGSLWSTQLADHQDLTAPYSTDIPLVTGKSRVSGTTAFLGQLPIACLAEEIDTPGEGQLRGLVTFGANPMLSSPGAERLGDAFGGLDFMISIDNYINETTRFADLIFPAPSVLEQPHWDVYGWAFALKSGGHYSPTVFERKDRPEEWQVLTRLGTILGGEPHLDLDELDDEYFAAMCDVRGIDRAVAFAASPHSGPERILDLAIRSGPFGDRYGERPEGLTLQNFKDDPRGKVVADATPLGSSVLNTATGKIEMAHPHFLADVGRLEAAMTETPSPMVLVSRRQLGSLNSWLHNVDSLVRGKNRCTLYIHPADAASAGLKEGDFAVIESASGAVTLPVEVQTQIRPGVVSLPHGWGHDAPGARLRVAGSRPGANSNLLSPRDLRDPASGNAVFNGIPVRVTKAEG
jgi:anaerobic selenocysteine-containing dehydrogenase